MRDSLTLASDCSSYLYAYYLFRLMQSNFLANESFKSFYEKALLRANHCLYEDSAEGHRVYTATFSIGQNISPVIE